LQLAPPGLAAHNPEAAATIQGGIRALTARLIPPSNDRVLARRATGEFVALTADARRAATEVVVRKLGEQRLRELRAIGESMQPDQLYRYAREHINAYLASLTP